jgi:hypothetical protein
MSIFISVPTLKDPEILNTILSAIRHADKPESVSIGVAAFVDDEFYNSLIRHTKDIKNLFIDKYDCSENTGVGIGRIYAKLRYDNQDNFLQVDSHTHFEKGWDTKLNKLWLDALAETGNDKTVISAYLPAYTRKDGQIFKNDNTCGYSIFSKQLTCMNWNKVGWIDMPLEKISKGVTKTFVPALKVSGTFILSDYHYADYSGHLPNMKFFDEEIIQSIELFSNGFSLAFPNTDIPLLHYYSDKSRQAGKATLEEMEASMDAYIHENPDRCKIWEDYARVDLRESSFQKWYIPNTYSGE